MIVVYKGKLFHDVRELADYLGWRLSRAEARIRSLEAGSLSAYFWLLISDEDANDPKKREAAIMRTTSGELANLDIKYTTASNGIKNAQKRILDEARVCFELEAKMAAHDEYVQQCLIEAGCLGE